MEPAPSLVLAERHRRRASAGSADHLVRARAARMPTLPASPTS
ncbi:hypothetical protein SBADM41S_07887 [Streptomyces badius]